MGLFSFTKKKPTLSQEQKQEWPKIIANYYAFEEKKASLEKKLNAHLQSLQQQTEQLLKPETIAKIPERAQDISEQHAKRIYEESLKLQKEGMQNLFLLQDDIEKTLDELAGFTQKTNKNFSALKEYLQEELQLIKQTVQLSEDLLIKTAEQLEEGHYANILRLQKVLEEQENINTKKEKYEKTINKYLTEKRHIEQKEQKHLVRIEEQKNLVRDEQAIIALSEVKEIEEENAAIAQKYSRLIFDTKHYILKNLLTINESLKQLFETIHKDPLYALEKHQETIIQEFKQLAQTLSSLEAQDNKNVISRLEEATKEVNEDLQTIQENTPRLHSIKKTIMNDIAAINIYEQEQFLIKTQEEKSKVQEKIDVLAEALDELQVDALISEEEDLLEKLDFKE